MQVGIAPISIGWVIAILVLLLVVVFAVVGEVDGKIILGLIGGLALARLL